MKTNIHPTWYENTQVTCVCGKMFTIGSTKPELRVEVCKFCHPFFTGEMRYVDTEGKVERFQKKQALAKKQAPVLLKKKAKKKGLVKTASEVDTNPKTLKEMLLGLR